MFYNWFSAGILPFAISYAAAFIVLIIGSITDLKTREVPDSLNYGLVFSGLGLNLLFSIVYSTASYIISSLIGLAIFFGIAYVMFYAGQWGGGDSKMLMGLGSMIGVDIGSKASNFMLGFFVNALFVGAVYGLLWSILLAIKNKKRFVKEFNRILMQEKIIRAKKFIIILLILAFIGIFIAQFLGIVPHLRILMLLLAFMVIATFYLWVFAKAIEKSSMYKLVEPRQLTEGDWIVRNIYAKGKYITGPKDLGIEKRQIKKLIELYKGKKVGKILIKEGIPFVPSFLMAFVVTLIFGNLIVLLI